MPTTCALHCIVCVLHLVVLSQSLSSVVLSADGSVVFGRSARPGPGDVPTEQATSPVEDKDKDESETVDMRFGGEKFAQGKHHTSHPELVKSETCDKNVCRNCKKMEWGRDGPSDCWHGDSDDSLHIYVTEKGKQGNSFIAEVWARCSSGGGLWQIKDVEKFKNGVLSVYVDQLLVRQVTPETMDEQRAANPLGANIQTEGTKPKPLFMPIPIQGNQKARIRIVFQAQDPSEEAEVSVKFEATNVDAAVQMCMSVKNCLARLGDGSAAGFELRNNNKFQLTCLRGQGDKLDGDLPAKCIEWTACMSEERKLHLKTFLEAADGNEGGGVGGNANKDKDEKKTKEKGKKRGKEMLVNQHSMGSSLAGASEDPLQCINPDVDDPESWECECLQWMIDQCGMSEKCFRSVMCAHEGVCGHWKQRHCNSEADRLQEQNGSTGAMTQRAAVNTGSAGRSQMESSMRGKCVG